MQTDPLPQSANPVAPHQKFGPLLFDQNYPVVPGIAGVAFGVIIILAGVASLAMRNGNPKFLIAGICGLGAGAIITASSIHFLLVKTRITYHFYQSGLVYRNRSSVIEAAYSELTEFSVKTSQSGGKMPGTFFNMHFTTRDGARIKYQLGVDKGDVDRMVRAKTLIEHLTASIPAAAPK